jgi:hypothetical protein
MGLVTLIFWNPMVAVVIGRDEDRDAERREEKRRLGEK